MTEILWREKAAENCNEGEKNGCCSREREAWWKEQLVTAMTASAA